MEDYFCRILNIASDLGQWFIQFIDDAFGFYYYDSSPYDYEASFAGYFSDEEFLIYPHNIRENHVVNTCPFFDGLRSTVSSLIKKGLTLPLYGLELGCTLATCCFECCILYVQQTRAKLQGLIDRLRRTLEGSSEDIGWLQKTKGLPPVLDGTSQFTEILHDVRNGVHRLPNTLVYLFIPGLFSNHSPLYFVSTKKIFSKMGLTCHIAKIHSEASVEKNAWELKQYIEELYWGSGKKIMLLGHSKGGIDAASAISMYWSDLKEKVAGLALVQSPYGGTPIASDIVREGQIADKESRRIMEFIICKLIKGDMRSLEDLTYEKRKDFISKHGLPSDELPIISFHTEASSAPNVLASVSLIAHAGLPLPRFLAESFEVLAARKVPVVMPMSAAMAISALHLRLRYGERSDGLVTRRDAEVPGSVVVRLERKLDHAWMVHSSLSKSPIEADCTEMCEALLTMLLHVGKGKMMKHY